jgi:hypothetical protein
MAEVYFSKDINKIIDKIDMSKLGKRVAIKMHFGEKGCDTYLNPEIVKKVYEAIVSTGRKTSLVDCNVLYRGSRTTREEHIEIAKTHGFGFADIDILDGEKGEEFIEVDGYKLGKGIEKYDSFIVLSHFKGHIMVGFGGALKNIGMGFASRAGKLDLHCNIKPSISSRCIGCGICINSCNAKAISIVKGKAEINKNLCEGCAICIAVCPNKAVSIPWKSKSTEELQKGIVKYSLAVLKKFPKTIFINVLKNITEDCDCLEKKQEPVIEDIGFLYSDDVLSIEKASLELANKKGFREVQKTINKDKQIEFAEQAKLGDKDYKIIYL